MLQDFNTAEMTEIFTRGRQTLGNTNSFLQKAQKSLLTTPPCILASVPSLENKPLLALLCSWMVQGSGALCADIVALLLLLHLQPEFLLLAFEESYDSVNPNDKHKIFPSPQRFLVKALEEAILQRCCAGDGDSLPCATEAGNRKRLYLYTIKI